MQGEFKRQGVEWRGTKGRAKVDSAAIIFWKELQASTSNPQSKEEEEEEEESSSSEEGVPKVYRFSSYI
jgi:hypothetical protein